MFVRVALSVCVCPAGRLGGTSVYKLCYEREEVLESALAAVAAVNVTSRLLAMHKGGLAHNDLHPNNVLMASDDGGVTFIDFATRRFMLQSGVPFPPEQADLATAPALPNLSVGILRTKLQRRGSDPVLRPVF